MFLLLFVALYLPYALAHVTAWHPAMWGFNFTTDGNRPQDPLMDQPFKGWWFHNHLDYPPNKGDFLEFPAGGKTTVETTCDKGATSYFTSNPGGQIKPRPNETDYPCPFQPTQQFHTESFSDLKGCAFAIAYIPPSQVSTIKPEDFTIFTVNHTCVWTRFTSFSVPARMPACPPGGCTCAWFWVHSADSGSEQIYMNGYQCNITNSSPSNSAPLAKPQLARRCGEDTDPESLKPADPKNCTYGAKQPIYWLQTEGNTFFENPHHPPYYNPLYAFSDGAQNDIFVDSELPEMDWSGAPVKSNGVYQTATGNFGSAKPGGGGGGSQAPPQSSSTSTSTFAATSSSEAPSSSDDPAPPATSGPAPPPATSDPAPPPATSDPAPPQPSSSYHHHHHKGTNTVTEVVYTTTTTHLSASSSAKEKAKGTRTVTNVVYTTTTALANSTESETNTISPAEASQIASQLQSQPPPHKCVSSKDGGSGGEKKLRKRRSSSAIAHIRAVHKSHSHLHRRPRKF